MSDKIKLAEELARKAGEIRANTFDDEGELKARIYEGLAYELLKAAKADPSTIARILSMAGERREYRGDLVASKIIPTEDKHGLSVGGYDGENDRWYV